MCVDWVQLAQDREQRGSCEHDNKPSGSIKVEKSLDYLSNIYLLMDEFAPSYIIPQTSACKESTIRTGTPL
jgi:hypothetical protein